VHTRCVGQDPATSAPSHEVAAGHPSRHADPVRAALVAGYRGDGALARSLLGDRERAVRVAALGALERCGELRAEDLELALGDPDPHVRRRALELAARRAGRPGTNHDEEPGLLRSVRTALGDPDPLVVEAACWSVGEAGDARALVDLSKLVRAHGDPRVREAAVAGIGAIVAGRDGADAALRDGADATLRDGADAALEAVLQAAADKPAVRRRAAVALSAFTGPVATAALERLAGDRDWQVRQVAAEILDA